MLENGAISIRRTSKHFSRSPVDLTLEQTVNKDAASRHTGIAAFTNNEATRRRWMLTRPIRANIVGSLMEYAGLKNRDEVSQELNTNRIKRDNSDLNKIVECFKVTLNPFDPSCNNNNLYSVETGRASSSTAANDMLKFYKIGNERSDSFISECKTSPERFQKPIKRNKVKNFAYDSVKMKVKTKDLKVKEVRCTRDLFGRLLFLATKQNIDLQILLEYPLLAVPISLCHYDGKMNKTKKSALMDKLEKISEPYIGQVSADVYLIDAMFFFRTLPTLPFSFAGIARVIMEKACTFKCPVIHLICDRYDISPSIKDLERASRGDNEGAFIIKGGEQKRPTDFMNSLLSSNFKNALVEFLKDEWQHDSYAKVLNNHIFYFAIGKNCYRYHVFDGKMHRNLVQELACDHLEADTRIMFHARYVSEQIPRPSTCVVRASDTDVFILLLYFASTLNGLSSKNSRRFINVSKIATSIGPTVCSALPAYHAFTGCDYTAAFLRKGKLRPYDLMVQSRRYTEAFNQLGLSENVRDSTSDILEEFVCAMYSRPKLKKVNKARLEIFDKIYAPQDGENPLETIKTSDPTCLPPCKSVLCQKIERTNYVALIWKNAIMANPMEIEPNNRGWKLSGDGKIFEMVLDEDDLHSEDEMED